MNPNLRKVVPLNETKFVTEETISQLLSAVVEGMKTLSDIADSLETISLYFERKGSEEGLFSEEDFESPPENNGPEDPA